MRERERERERERRQTEKEGRALPFFRGGEERVEDFDFDFDLDLDFERPDSWPSAHGTGTSFSNAANC